MSIVRTDTCTLALALALARGGGRRSRLRGRGKAKTAEITPELAGGARSLARERASILPPPDGSGHGSYGWSVNGAVVTNRALSTSFESAIGGVAIAKHGSYSSHAFKAFSLVRQ